MRVFVYGVVQSEIVQAVSEGLKRCGHQVLNRSQSTYRENNYEKCEAAVTFGLHSPGPLIVQEHQAQGVPVLIIDYGYVKRGTNMYSGIDRSLYYSISLNALNGRSDPFPSPMLPDRWRKLETELQPWKMDGKFVMVCGQKENDVAIGNLNPLIWARQTIQAVQNISDRPVVFRPHPLSPSQKRPIGIPHVEMESFQEALRDVYAIVAYNSNALVEATVAGVPTFTLGEGSMVSGVTNTTLAALKNPELFDREQWAADLAWRQYRLDEFRSGLFWQYAIEKTIATSLQVVTEPVYATPQVSTEMAEEEISEMIAEPHRRGRRPKPVEIIA